MEHVLFWKKAAAHRTKLSAARMSNRGPNVCFCFGAFVSNGGTDTDTSVLQLPIRPFPADFKPRFGTAYVFTK